MLDSHNKAVESKDDIDVPKGWKWSWEKWIVDTDRAVDNEGWQCFSLYIDKLIVRPIFILLRLISTYAFFIRACTHGRVEIFIKFTHCRITIIE